MRAGEVGTQISPDLPDGRRRLAETLKSLYQHIRPVAPSLRALQRLLLTEHGYAVNRGGLSRYFNGRVVPDRRFGEVLYAAASKAAGKPASVGFTLEEVWEAHDQAEPTSSICKECPDLRRQNDTLRKENGTLLKEQAGLLQSLASAHQRSTPPPVPLRGGDRRRFRSDIEGAKHIAKSAAILHYRGKRDAALAMLMDTAGALTPLESAASIAVLRAERDTQLADTLIHIYGDERTDSEIIEVALALHDQGMSGDAEAVLRSATQQGA
ncbi:hypothetical protein [Streptomyces sp. NPDC051561]|uniref:hypothetical protein n=1 Tax=Streptomyces sp. NPDC051561 TaxID=3365658 RepID=UPI00379F0B20